MMLDWNQYREQFLKTIGDLGRLGDRQRLLTPLTPMPQPSENGHCQDVCGLV